MVMIFREVIVVGGAGFVLRGGKWNVNRTVIPGRSQKPGTRRDEL
jgi:hypothetical protein